MAALPTTTVRGGKVVRVTPAGKIVTLLEKVDVVGVAADPVSGDVLAADNVAHVLTLLPGGRASDARTVLAIEGHKGHCMALAVAFTADGHLLLGGTGPVGVFRFKGGPSAVPGDPLVGENGAVAGAPWSKRWAAALDGQLRLFEDTKELARLPYPAGRRHSYSAVALGPGGVPIVALQLGANRYEVVQADRDRAGFKTLFTWEKSKVVSLAIGPKMAWKE